MPEHLPSGLTSSVVTKPTGSPAVGMARGVVGLGRKPAAPPSPTGEHLSQAVPCQKRGTALAEDLKMSALFFSETIFAFYILIILNFGKYLVESLYSVVLGTCCTYRLISIASTFFLHFLNKN